MSNKFKQSQENLKNILSQNPDLRKAFKETINEMSKPENVEKMAKEISSVVQKIDSIKVGLKNNKIP